MATHDLDLVRSFGQRIIFLEDGSIFKDREKIYVGDLRDRISDSQVSQKAEQLKEHDLSEE
jgi:ABC-type phosphate/phosphonate transport system ATPase subunit